MAPSFNDIRLILNTAQLYGLRGREGGGSTKDSHNNQVVDLITFDGDLTLYDDGGSLTADSPLILRIMRLLKQRCKVAIVTAAGYTEAEKYYTRLGGLIDAMRASDNTLMDADKKNLVVMGGESNFLFRYDQHEKRLSYVPREEWLLDEMKAWRDDDIIELLDIAESSLRACVSNLGLFAAVLRKDRSVGIFPLEGRKMHREQLEETVLVVQNTIERTAVGTRLPFCAFNGMFLIFYIVITIGENGNSQAHACSVLSSLHLLTCFLKEEMTSSSILEIKHGV